MSAKLHVTKINLHNSVYWHISDIIQLWQLNLIIDGVDIHHVYGINFMYVMALMLFWP